MRAFFTGVTSGIGNEVLHLAHLAGWQLVVLVRNQTQAQELEAKYPGLRVILGDLGDIPALKKIIQETLSHETFDLILLNAACATIAPFLKQGDDDIERTLNVNLMAPMLLLKALLPQMKPDVGRVTLVSSLVANVAGPDFAPYAASKAALSSLHHSLSAGYPHLHFLCVEIGAVQTPFHQKAGYQGATHRFKKSSLISHRLFKALQNKTGVTTLAVDWTLIRFLLTGLKDFLTWGMRRRRAVVR